MSTDPYVYIWEYQIRTETEADFLAHYKPDGAWSRLFRRAPGYLGTELYRDRERRDRFITIDRWRSEADFQDFRTRFAAAFDALDHLCSDFATQERRLGTFVPVAGAGSVAP